MRLLSKAVSAVAVLALVVQVAAAIGAGAAMSGLDLTQEQRSRIGAIEQQMDKEIAPLKAALQDIRGRIDTELAAQEPDKQKLDRLINEASSVMAKIQQQQVSFMLKVREQLTPDQKQKLSVMMQQAGQGAAGN